MNRMALEPKICIVVIILVAISAGFGQFLLNCLLENWGTALVALGSGFTAMLCLCYLAMRGQRMNEAERYITTAKHESEKFRKRRE